MVSAVFRRAVRDATGIAWEEWVARLKQTVDPSWSHERMKGHICETYRISDEWGEWLAVLYGQAALGRTPVGVTKDAGVQIGVRRTWEADRGRLWHFLMSPRGAALWIGTLSDFRPERGFEFASTEGITGKIAVIRPLHRLRTTWKRPEWDRPSRLQITLLSTNTGKTTVAIHQEMLEDVYLRELMRRHWEATLNRIQAAAAGDGTPP